jgi:hypothetical protein
MKENYNKALELYTEDPKIKVEKAIRSRISSRSFSTASMLELASTISCSTTGMKALGVLQWEHTA